MKKFRVFILSLSLMLPALAMASSQPFSGFNASLGVGLDMPDIFIKCNLLLSVPSTQESQFNIFRTTTSTKINGGARIGYNYIFENCFLVGLAVDGVFGKNKIKFDSRVTELNSDLLIESSADVNLSNQYALLLKFGRLVCDRTLFYGLVGPQWGKYSFQFDATLHQNLGVIFESELHSRQSCYRGGLLLGIGTEFLLTHCISLALEYKHTYYGRCKLADVEAPVTMDGGVFPGAVFMRSTKFNARNNNVMLRLGFYY